MFDIEHCYLVRDKATLAIVVAGKLLLIKNCIGISESQIHSNQINKTVQCNILNGDYLSFDQRYFFHTRSNKYSIEETDKDNTVKLNIPSNYVIDAWSIINRIDKSAKHFYEIDIFEEHTFEELDIEIKTLVETLNKIGFTTTASCCGHHETYANVTVWLKNTTELNRFRMYISILKTKFDVSLDEKSENLMFYNLTHPTEKLVYLYVAINKDDDIKQKLDIIANELLSIDSMYANAIDMMIN